MQDDDSKKPLPQDRREILLNLVNLLSKALIQVNFFQQEFYNGKREFVFKKEPVRRTL